VAARVPLGTPPAPAAPVAPIAPVAPVAPSAPISSPEQNSSFPAGNHESEKSSGEVIPFPLLVVTVALTVVALSIQLWTMIS